MSNVHLDNQSKQLQEAFNEISNLRCKLDSKSRASVILSQDLLECKRERDEYKLMHDQIKERYSALKRRIEGSSANFMGINEDPNNLTSASFAQILCKLNKQNKMLLYELEEVKTKLIDAEGDVRLLRGQINSMKRRPGLTNMHSSSIISNSSSVGSSSSSCTASSTIKEYPDEINEKNGSNSVNEGCNALQGMSSGSSTAITTLSSSLGRQKDEKQALVAQLEMIKQRNSLMEKDMKSLLDEKEELIMIRDAYKAKVERLNGRLNNLLREQSDDPTNEANDTKTIDIDSLINENNFLREKMSQLEEEKKRLKTLCTKYRNILERSTPSTSSSMFSSLKSSSDSRSKLLADSQVLSNNVISSKQVQAFIASNNLNNLQLSQATLVNLKSLVIALFESLTDKSSALALQRKNNRLLGERLEELEEKIKQLKAREKVFFLMKDNVKAQLYHQEDLEDDLILHPREESTRFTPLSLTSQNDNDNTSCNKNDSNDNENDLDSKIINEEFESLAGESDDEIQLPSNLKALVDGEVLKLKQNDDC